MPQSFLIFDFGTSEDAAQQARHKIEGWTQAFRLKGKMKQRFERVSAGGNSNESAEGQTTTGTAAPKKSKAEPRTSSPRDKSKTDPEDSGAGTGSAPDQVRVLVYLQFSDHEKLSHQRWVERLPSEEPFRSASPRIIHNSDAEFAKTAELFESLAESFSGDPVPGRR